MITYDNIISYCRNLLLEFPEAKDIASYVNKRLSQAAQEKFLFGYFPSHNNLNTIMDAFGEKDLKGLDLLYDKNIQDGVSSRKVFHSGLENHNLILPYRDVYGNIVAIVGRTILNDEQRGMLPKYKNTSFIKGNHLFGLFEAKSSILEKDEVFIVEGQFDCISAQDKGLNNVIALGSSNMTFDQFALLKRYTNNIMLLLDNDEAGRLGSERVIKAYGKYGNIKNIVLPNDYKDLDEFLSCNTIDDFKFVI